MLNLNCLKPVFNRNDYLWLCLALHVRLYKLINMFYYLFLNCVLLLCRPTMKCMCALLSGLYRERRFINLVRYDTMSDAIKG